MIHFRKRVILSSEDNQDREWVGHRLRPIDTHLALYTMLNNNSAKNRYAEPKDPRPNYAVLEDTPRSENFEIMT